MNKSTNLNNSSIASTQFSWDSFWNSKRVNHEILKEWSKYFFRSYENQIGFKVDDVILDYGAGWRSFNTNESHGKKVLCL